MVQKLITILSLLLCFVCPGRSGEFINGLNYLGSDPNDRDIQYAKDGQGITQNEDYWFLSQQHYLWKLPIDRPLSRSIEKDYKYHHPKVKIPWKLRLRGYNHFGDPSYFQGKLYVPLEGIGAKLLLVYDADSMLLENTYKFPKFKHDAPWVAVHPRSGQIYTSDFDPKKGKDIFVFEIRQEKLELVATHRLNDGIGIKLEVKRIQGGVIDEENNLLLLASDHKKGGIYAFDMENYNMVFHHQVKYKPQFPYYEEIEGLTITPDLSHLGIKGRIHLVIVDNDLNGDEISIRHYDYSLQSTLDPSKLPIPLRTDFNDRIVDYPF